MQNVAYSFKDDKLQHFKTIFSAYILIFAGWRIEEVMILYDEDYCGLYSKSGKTLIENWSTLECLSIGLERRTEEMLQRFSLEVWWKTPDVKT